MAHEALAEARPAIDMPAAVAAMAEYYAARAAEYERVDAKPERQADLGVLQAWLPAHRLHVVGLGERQLLVPTPDNTPEALNRRVEITLY